MNCWWYRVDSGWPQQFETYSPVFAGHFVEPLIGGCFHHSKLLRRGEFGKMGLVYQGSNKLP